jgi:peptidoglycan/LPS O-acetylase OafA/YrhL
MNKAIAGQPKGNQLDSLVLLRCVAVLMVCLCHFESALKDHESLFGLLGVFEKYGNYGVHVFFVISGFIIPFSLLKGNYHLKNYPQFLYKRLLRLHPPYLAALGFTLIIMYLSYRTRHIPFPETVTTIFKSIFYIHTPPDNPVFWTLLVEAQYYLFVGLFYVLLMHHTRLAYLVAIPILLFLCHTVVRPYLLMSSYFVFFLLGNVAYMIYTNKGEKILNLVALTGLLLFITLFSELPALFFAIGTFLFILFFRKSIGSVPTFIGKISYSIYLIHFPLGVKFINFLKPKINPHYNLLLFGSTLVLTVAIAWVFYKVFEEFSERLSKKVKYTSTFAPANALRMLA